MSHAMASILREVFGPFSLLSTINEQAEMTLNSLNPCKSSCSHHSIDTGLTLKRLLPPSYDVFKDKIAPNCSHVS